MSKQRLTRFGETPVKSSQTSIQNRQQVFLEQCRLAVVDDLGHSLDQVSLSYFEHNVLPPLPDGLDIDAVINNLLLTDALRESIMTKPNAKTRRRRWTAFPLNFPDDKQYEDTAFDCLVGVVGAIVTAASTVCDTFQPRMEYKSRPSEDMLMVYDKENGSSRPDGYFVRSGFPERREKRNYWHEIAVLGEYSNRGSDESPAIAIENRQQTCWNLYQQLRQDPRRRFALAFTIEKTATRFWFCNRSRAFVSKPFDFLCEGYATFIRFILRVVAAEDHQLGWDTTMVQRPLDTIDTPITPSNLMYDMEVHGEGGGTYRTMELLSDVGARAVNGRGTRVWKAKKVQRIDDDEEPSGPEVALKDAWVDAGRTREAKILETLKSSGKGKVFEVVVKHHLLTVKCYGDVLINGVPDHTLELHTKGQRIPISSRGTNFPLVYTSIPSGGTLSGTNTESHMEKKRLRFCNWDLTSSPTDDTSQTQEKQHHRIVFEEIADSLHSCNELSEIFRALAQIALVLKPIHQAGNGWVHRDVSAGNILIASDGKAKLADLEYMKELSDKNEVRTGTLYFIACEAHSRRYLYAGIMKGKDAAADERPTKRTRLQDPADSQHKSPEEVEQDDEDEYLQAVAKARDRRRATQPKAKVVSVPANRNLVFFHNALHDLESILWIAIYFLFDKEPISHLPETSAQAASEGNTTKIWNRKKQLQVAAALFYDKYARVNAMAPHFNWQRYVDVLHPACQPAAMLIGEMRQLLIDKYTQVESHLSMDIRRSDIGGSLYLDFGRMLQDAADSLEGVVVQDLSRVVLF